MGANTSGAGFHRLRTRGVVWQTTLLVSAQGRILGGWKTIAGTSGRSPAGPGALGQSLTGHRALGQFLAVPGAL